MKALRIMHLIPAAALLCGTLVLHGSARAQEEAAPAAPEAAPADEAAPQAETAAKSDWVSGSFDFGIDARHTDRDSDLELDQYLRLSLTPPKYPKLSLRGALWTIEDLDGKESSTSVLRNLNDAGSGDARARLLYLYLEADDVWGDSTLRLGRQRILESPAYNRMDGLYFKKRLDSWDWYAFGGARASVYNDAHEDLVFGGGVSALVLPRTRAALDFFYGEDNRNRGVRQRRGLRAILLGYDYPREVALEEESRELSLTLTHQLNMRNHLYARYTWHDGDSDEFKLAASGVITSRDIAYNLTYRRRLNLLTDRTNDVTGYYRILGGFDEYDDLEGTLYIPVAERYSIGLEAQVHDSDRKDLGNRDFNRFALVLSGDELAPGLDAELVLERWDVNNGEGTWAVTGEVSKTWNKLELTLGADYERYEERLVLYRSAPLALSRVLNFVNPAVFPRFNPLVGLFDEKRVDFHENIHSVYLRADYDLTKAQALWAELSYEEDDGPDSPYWRLQAQYSIQF